MTREQETIIGESDALLEALEQASSLAPLTQPVIITGERGTGKELIACRLHYLSTRWSGPFVAINCAALNENLLDSELFGHDAGAFTGAHKRHLGRFERAHGGTLFLDEIAAATPQVQEKLLRVVEYGELERVGGQQALKVDVRVVCATHENLPEQVDKGKFRADLLDRLAFDVVNLAPLRERKPDIILLAQHFAIQMCRQLNRSFFTGFSDKAKRELLDWPWYGNIRELKNVVERSIYRHTTTEQLDTILFNPFKRRFSDNCALPSSAQSLPALPLDLRGWQRQQEKTLVEISLQQSHFRQPLAARLLGISYHQLRALLKKHGINVEDIQQ